MVLIQDTWAERWGWDAVTLVSPDLALATHPAIRATSAPRTSSSGTSRSGGEADFPGKVRPCVGSRFVALQSEDAGEALLCWLPRLAAQRLLQGQSARARGSGAALFQRGEQTPRPRAVLLHCMAAAAKCPPDQDTAAKLLESLTKLCQTILL